MSLSALVKAPPLHAALAGALAVCGFAPVDCYPLVILALGVLFYCLHGAATQARGLVLGYAWGLGCFFAGVSWVYVSMHDAGGMNAAVAALATLAFAATLACFPALAGGLWVRLKCGRALADALLFAALWGLAEMLRGHVLSGFPWLSVGYSQLSPSPLAGYAPWLGVYGVGIASALVAALAVCLIRGELPRPLRRHAGVLILLIAAAGFAASRVSWTEAAGRPLRLSLLQGNIPQEIKWDPQQLALSIDTYSRLAAAHPADLVILPETAIPLLFAHIPQQTLEALTRSGPAILGAAVGTGNEHYVIAAVALQPGAAADPAQMRAQMYAKRHLVPFGEYIPPGFSWFFQLVNIPMTGFSVGPPQQKPLLIGDQALWPTVCYEDLFGEEMVAGAGVSTILLNLSNTAWFGHSLAQPQHLQIARMRALESGRPMVRATNTGMTASIAADGRVLAQLEPFSEGGLTVTVQGRSGLTPYLRVGNLAALLLALALALPALVRARGASLKQ